MFLEVRGEVPCEIADFGILQFCVNKIAENPANRDFRSFCEAEGRRSEAEQKT